ncbi:hypothetical protein [Nocardia sp. NPDC019395]|uniref:hypothetical protein n=1 Tax=Nocardia sp. NPDC019395 TaxID=3154686 RepID=UPI0033CA90EA
MVRPDPALRRLLRETQKLLEPYGFHGSDPRWVRVEPGGVAAVERTRASRTWTDGQQVLRFDLHLTATPTAWWEFGNWRNSRLGLPAIPLEAATGPDLITTRNPAEPWILRTAPDGHVPQADIDSVRAELPRRIHAYARRALQLVEPGIYLDELVARADPHIGTWETIVVLLAGHGPGQRLDDAIQQLYACCAGREPSEYTRDVIAYAQRTAARSAAARTPEIPATRMQAAGSP